MKSLVNNFSSYYKKKYGKPVGKIALGRNVPCPNRMKGGCIFCAPESFRPYYLSENDPLSVQIQKGKKFLKSRKFKYYFAYFQQETSTAGSYQEIMADFSYAVEDSACVGLIISTRPDYLAERLLDELDRLAQKSPKPLEIIIELGLQSAHDKTLRAINRNHTYEDFVMAADRVKGHDSLQLGAHLILGLPGEDFADMQHTVAEIGKLGVQHLKIHHLQVIKGTQLQVMYEQGAIKTFTAQQYMQLLVNLLNYVAESVVLHRLWSISDPHLLLAPRWGMNNHKLSALIRDVMEAEGCWQGKHLRV
jgi:radical SAM protein (TIGR01212 family)